MQGSQLGTYGRLRLGGGQHLFSLSEGGGGGDGDMRFIRSCISLTVVMLEFQIKYDTFGNWLEKRAPIGVIGSELDYSAIILVW